MKVDWPKVVKFPKIGYVLKNIPLLASLIDLVDLPWKDEVDANGDICRIQSIFQKKTVGGFNVDSLFLQLIASAMILLESTTGGLKWIIVKSREPENIREQIYSCDIYTYWTGINIF